MSLVVLVYAGMSVVTFTAYAVDKRAATKQRRRVPEASLHMLAALGGVPGALIAQQVLRHKRRKVKFMAVTIGIVLLHVAGWVAWWLLR